MIREDDNVKNNMNRTDEKTGYTEHEQDIMNEYEEQLYSETNKTKNLWEIISKTKTGEGDVEDYINHPLNWDGSEDIAKIIRGITGFLGSTDLAIVDIIFGLLKYSLRVNKG